MAKFTDEQASAAYADCVIKKRTETNSPDKGCRHVVFKINEEDFHVDIDSDVLEMNATPDQVKTYFINKLKEEIDYPSAPATIVEAVEAKVKNKTP
jgi:hypothetical protein